MQIYFHSRLCSYLPRVPILVEDTVAYRNVNNVSVSQLFRYFFSPQKKFIMVQNDTRENKLKLEQAFHKGSCMSIHYTFLK